MKRKLYSLYFDTGLFQKWQKTSYSKNNNVFNEYRQYNSCQNLQPGLNLSPAKRMTLVSNWNYLTTMQKKKPTTTMNKQSEVMVRCQEKKKKTENKRRVFPPLK
jgi:uncharacterized short protein YbdD (DUF466 family)